MIINADRFSLFIFELYLSISKFPVYETTLNTMFINIYGL